MEEFTVRKLYLISGYQNISRLLSEGDIFLTDRTVGTDRELQIRLRIEEFTVRKLHFISGT